MPKRKAKENVTIKRDDPIVCPCGLAVKDEYHATFFSWQNINGRVVFVCWTCADKIHKKAIKKDKEGSVEH